MPIMRKSFIFLLLFIIHYSQTSEAQALRDQDWKLWNGVYAYDFIFNYVPYNFKNAFWKVKGGYRHCKMRVFKASIKFGELTPNDTPSLEYELDYDELGRLANYYRQNHNEDFDGDLDSYYCRYEYDGKTDRILSESFYSDKNYTQCRGSVVYGYDTKNRIKTITRFNNNNSIQWMTKYEYANNGKIIRYEYDWNGALMCKATDIKDAKGRFHQYSYSKLDNEKTEIVSYNVKGWPDRIDFTEKYHGTIRKAKGKYFVKFYYKYDNYGNIVGRVRETQKVFNYFEIVHCKYSMDESE